MTIPTSANGLSGDKKELVIDYSGTVTIKGEKGMVPAPYKGKFTVRKPEISIKSAAVQNLYRECGNAVEIDVPALGDLYNPVVTATNCEVLPSKENKKKFMLMPGGGKSAVITVNNSLNGSVMKVGDVTYNVVDPPRPSVVVKINGQPSNGQTGIGKGSKVSVFIVPDPEFRNLLPADANFYAAGKIDVYAALSIGAPARVGGKDLSGQNAVNGIDVGVPPQATGSPGTKVFFELDAVYRKNFRGKMVKDPRFSLYELTITAYSK